jgi:Tfp pilus assembly protein PilV
MMNRNRSRSTRRRSGISLIEVVVACTLLAVTLTALTGLSARMAARTRNVGVIEQRTATYFQEVNRIESMPYDSIDNAAPRARYLVTDSVQSGNIWYVWSYAVGAMTYNSNPTSTSSYHDITLTVTPRTTGATPITGVIRRAKPGTVNSFNLP